ncbi:MAG: uridine kinase [Opitutae bacterium]|jgi:uridine kinase|nr:uridine kinase [Opitutae bacterium]MBT5910789.1 uridine kinase [Opitutae bacterium]MBT6850183.1 uridine kinase [Opitutae bacterium]MBT7741396.1 uridine kinase [Opitutae bacterium]
MENQPRTDILQAVAHRLAAVKLPHPLRVGIDGVSASGKTVLADELAGILQKMNRAVIRTGIDGFHNPPEIRHRRGSMSVEGYVEDSFDYSAVHKCVLEPLGPEGSLGYQSEIFDHATGTRKKSDQVLASPDAILLFEGVMLFRKEIANAFDYRILVDTTFEVALERAKTRDLKHFGNMQTLLEKYTRRFIPGQKRYLAECRPAEQANAIFQNDDPYRPKIKFNR